MGRIFLDHIGGTRLFSCANCDTILTNRSELISTRFTGATGRAFLFNKAMDNLPSTCQWRALPTSLAWQKPFTWAFDTSTWDWATCGHITLWHNKPCIARELKVITVLFSYLSKAPYNFGIIAKIWKYCWIDWSVPCSGESTRLCHMTVACSCYEALFLTTTLLPS